MVKTPVFAQYSK